MLDIILDVCIMDERGLKMNKKCSLYEMALIVAAKDLLYKYIDLSEKHDGLPRKDGDVQSLEMALKNYGVETTPF